MTRLDERIENFNKAFFLYSQMCSGYLSDKTSDTNRLALTQSYEIVFELAWKVLKDYLAQKGVEVHYPKDVIKEAFAANTLQNGQIWINMLKDRNASPHEYNTEKISEILEKISTVYFEELSRFTEQVKGFDE